MSQGTISSDGLFYWDGAQWQPTRSPDGMWRWTGSAWVASSDAGVTLQSVSGYSSPRWIGVWLSVLLGVSVAMALIAFLGELYFNLTLTLAGRDIVYSIDVGGLFIFAITSTVFLVWFGLSYRNLSFLGARDLVFTPGRAVGWWFVPLACWWKPYAALVEIWHASDPTAPATTSASPAQPHVTTSRCGGSTTSYCPTAMCSPSTSRRNAPPGRGSISAETPIHCTSLVGSTR